MDVTSKVKEILFSLSEEERRLFSRVLQVERASLHIKDPKLKDELLKSVREVIK